VERVGTQAELARRLGVLNPGAPHHVTP